MALLALCNLHTIENHPIFGTRGIPIVNRILLTGMSDAADDTEESLTPLTYSYDMQ